LEISFGTKGVKRGEETGSGIGVEGFSNEGELGAIHNSVTFSKDKRGTSGGGEC